MTQNAISAWQSRNKQLHTWIPSPVWLRFRQAAAEEGLGMGALLRRLVLEHLERSDPTEGNGRS